MRTFNIILSTILGLWLLYNMSVIFLISSSLPWDFYNKILIPSGIVAKNTLVSYDNFEIKSSFVDSVELNKFTFSRKQIPQYDPVAKDSYQQEEIQKNSIKIGTISINNTAKDSSYQYPDMTACIENKLGDLVYGLGICMNNCDNTMDSAFEIPANQTLSLEILASLDWFSYYKNGGYSEVNSYSPLILGIGSSWLNLTEEFSTKNLAQIKIYPSTYYKSSKGNMPYKCGDFYKNKSTPLAVIVLK